MFDPSFTDEYTRWLETQVTGMVAELTRIAPSELAEKIRYLPASVTPFSGYMSFNINPFMREIVDCFDVRSPVREVNLMKGVQTTYTTALETVLLYFMHHIKTAPVMFMTADAELAQARIENNIIPMINLSGISHIIQSSDPMNPRKTGKTRDHLQWVGGGYMVPFGANNANKMRMFSILALLKDEIDAWPDVVGKDGDPDKISDDRCAAYWERRKIFRGSTPVIRHSSKILRNYERGDQRKYYVNCRSCGFPQYLRWEGTNKQTGFVYGFHWEFENGLLIPDSVCYLCANCGHKHYEYDKTKLFAAAEGARWVPTASPVEPGVRSYHLPAFYSPVGMQPWSKNVVSWLDSWDTVRKSPKDNALLQIFYNNVLAQPYEINGDKLNFTTVSSLRRTEYRMGEVPNHHAERYAGSPIHILTCAVDVHDDNLAVAVFGWTVGRRAYLIDYWRFYGNCKDVDDAATWGELRKLIEGKEYSTREGDKYSISLTLIDAGYIPETVLSFCGHYLSGVYPIMGRQIPPKNARLNEFWQFSGSSGTIVWGVAVDLYKDRWAAGLRRYWDGASLQPEGHFNAPVDATDKQIKELTRETRREVKDKLTHKVIGAEWHRPSGADNELWDLLNYNSAALDMIAWDVCRNQLELEYVDWGLFWSHYTKVA